MQRSKHIGLKRRAGDPPSWTGQSSEKGVIRIAASIAAKHPHGLNTGRSDKNSPVMPPSSDGAAGENHMEPSTMSSRTTKQPGTDGSTMEASETNEVEFTATELQITPKNCAVESPVFCTVVRCAYHSGSEVHLHVRNVRISSRSHRELTHNMYPLSTEAHEEHGNIFWCHIQKILYFCTAQATSTEHVTALSSGKE